MHGQQNVKIFQLIKDVNDKDSFFIPYLEIGLLKGEVLLPHIKTLHILCCYVSSGGLDNVMENMGFGCPCPC